VRGASALQKALLRFPDAAVRVLVVWEPILKSDIGPPLPWILSTIEDARAIQFWDPRLALSDELERGGEADPRGTLAAAPKEIGPVFWDYIAFFPPGVRWGPTAPNPATWYYPVVNHMGKVQADIAAARPAPAR
jgi:hypothetical protein